MPIVKIILLFFCNLFIVHASIAQTNSFEGYSIYLVRHAEKDTGNDPALTKAGYTRSGDLYRFLKAKKIDRIYFSQYRRTRLTGDSLRIYEHIDTASYKADATGEDILKKINEHSGNDKNILIIGHSNTLPAIIKRLGVTKFDINEIPDNEYDHIFIVRFKKKKALLKVGKYGKASTAVASPASMKALQ